MAKIVNFEDFKKAVKIEEGKRWLKDKAAKTITWVVEHPAEAATLASGVTLGIGKVLKEYNKAMDQRREDCKFWDNRMGRYARSKRPLSRKESLEAERRFRNGESYKEILNDMGLLR